MNSTSYVTKSKFRKFTIIDVKTTAEMHKFARQYKQLTDNLTTMTSRYEASVSLFVHKKTSFNLLSALPVNTGYRC